MEYTPIGFKEGKIKMALNVDMKLKVPTFFLDLGCRQLGFEFITNIMKIARSY